MSVRLHEVHPTLAHYPLVLVPLAFIADFFGRLLGHAGLMRLGKGLMPVAAVSGVATAAAGLAAQEAVKVRPEARKLLITHRNLNAGMVGVIGALTIARLRRSRPSTGYLLAGAAIMAGMSYTAYLGGKMVYQHGVGVAPADGVKDEKSPDVCRGQLDEVAHLAADNIRQAAEDTLHQLKAGEIAPALRKNTEST